MDYIWKEIVAFFGSITFGVISGVIVRWLHSKMSVVEAIVALVTSFLLGHILVPVAALVLVEYIDVPKEDLYISLGLLIGIFGYQGLLLVFERFFKVKSND